MNLNIKRQIKGNDFIIGDIVINNQIMNVKKIKFFFIDKDNEIDIPCLAIWGDNSNNPDGDYTISRILEVESF